MDKLPSDSHDFICKTNDECFSWMDGFYTKGRKAEFNLHCLWAWQENERRHTAIQAELIEALSTLESTCGDGLAFDHPIRVYARNEIAKAKGPKP